MGSGVQPGPFHMSRAPMPTMANPSNTTGPRVAQPNVNMYPNAREYFYDLELKTINFSQTFNSPYLA